MPRGHATPRLGDRGLFPELEPRAYLNHAGISPPSLAVREAVLSLLLDYGRHGAKAFPSWSEQRGRLGGRLAELEPLPAQVADLEQQLQVSTEQLSARDAELSALRKPLLPALAARQLPPPLQLQ